MIVDQKYERLMAFIAEEVPIARKWWLGPGPDQLEVAVHELIVQVHLAACGACWNSGLGAVACKQLAELKALGHGEWLNVGVIGIPAAMPEERALQADSPETGPIERDQIARGNIRVRTPKEGEVDDSA